MNDTAKRIEMVRLIQALRKNDEAPGDTILRALRRASRHRAKKRRPVCADGRRKIPKTIETPPKEAESGAWTIHRRPE